MSLKGVAGLSLLLYKVTTESLAALGLELRINSNLL